MRVMRVLAAAALLAGPAAAQTQGEMNAAAARDLARADAALNVAYRAAMARMADADARNAADPRAPGPGRREALRAAQRAWIAFRDAECVHEGAAYAGGSMQPLTIATCRARLTRARTTELAAAGRTP